MNTLRIGALDFVAASMFHKHLVSRVWIKIAQRFITNQIIEMHYDENVCFSHIFFMSFMYSRCHHDVIELNDLIIVLSEILCLRHCDSFKQDSVFFPQGSMVFQTRQKGDIYSWTSSFTSKAP